MSDFYKQREINIIIFFAFVGSIGLLCVAIFTGEFKGTLIGPGKDVKFGTLVLDTQPEWWLFFAGQLALGIIDVYFYEYVLPYYNQLIDWPDQPINTKVHGKYSRDNKLILSLKATFVSLPMMIRNILAVVFVTTQLSTVIVVQLIKEVLVYTEVFRKLGRKKDLWIAVEEKEEDKDVKGYGSITDSLIDNKLQYRHNVVRF